MNVPRTLNANHPLFQQLRHNLLWHCTSVEAFQKISEDGSIRPATGTFNRWGNRPYACQTLGAVCLFDFASESQDKVLGTADRWGPFFCMKKPTTVVLGIQETRLQGRLVRYPENRDTTPEDSSGPIPWVEVCHVGEISVAAVTLYLLVDGHDYSRFTVHTNVAQV